MGMGLVDSPRVATHSAGLSYKHCPGHRCRPLPSRRAAWPGSAGGRSTAKLLPATRHQRCRPCWLRVSIPAAECEEQAGGPDTVCNGTLLGLQQRCGQPCHPTAEPGGLSLALRMQPRFSGHEARAGRRANARWSVLCGSPPPRSPTPRIPQPTTGTHAHPRQPLNIEYTQLACSAGLGLPGCIASPRRSRC